MTFSASDHITRPAGTAGQPPNRPHPSVRGLASDLPHTARNSAHQK